jgi:site-specific DNA-methyltransferase (adenine-specific)
MGKQFLGSLELNRIYQRDCIEGMRMIPDGSIDMILCDLPYGTTACKWDSIISFEQLWGQYDRIIKDDGAIVLTAAQPFTTSVIQSKRKRDKETTVYNDMGLKDGEYTQKFTNYPTQVLTFGREGKTVHPTQKPIALFEYLVKTYTNEGEIVLDNCMGSGTTAVACVRTNRNFIGFEREPEYVEIANKRLDNESEAR